MYVDTYTDSQIDTSISFFSIFICLKQCLSEIFNVHNVLLDIDKGTFLIHGIKSVRISDIKYLNNAVLFYTCLQIALNM